MIICEVVAKEFKKDTNRDLCLSESELKCLKSVVTLKAEKKKNPNFSRMPITGLFTITKAVEPTPISQPINSGNDRKAIFIKNDNKKIFDCKLEEFRILRVIGRGSFGKVCLVKFNQNGKLYAMKSLKKDLLIDQDQIENTLLEKNILENIKSQFLVELEYCFQTDDRIYFVMPFMR